MTSTARGSMSPLESEAPRWTRFRAGVLFAVRLFAHPTFDVLERRIYALEHPTHLDPNPPRDRRRDR